MISIRPGGAADRPILEAMLYEAAHWHAASPRTTLEAFRRTPEFVKLLDGWGTRAGDTARIAESPSTPVGAAWYRFWNDENHSYGFVRSSVPEVAIAVEAKYRSQGIGRSLLESLCEAARGSGLPGLSLSVDPANFALRLYESVGFRRVGESGTSHTLLLELCES